MKGDVNSYDNFQIPVNQTQTESITSVLEKMAAGKTDSISEQLSIGINVQNYSPLGSTYLSTTTSGKMSLIKDLEVKKKLINFYDILAVEAEYRGRVQLEYYMNEIIPWMIDNTDMLDVEPEDVIKDKKFINRLFIYGQLIRNKNQQYRDIAKAGKLLVTELEEYHERL